MTVVLKTTERETVPGVRIPNRAANISLSLTLSANLRQTLAAESSSSSSRILYCGQPFCGSPLTMRNAFL